MRIAIISSVGACGIAEHSKMLANALTTLGHETIILPCTITTHNLQECLRDFGPHIIHLQHEHAIASDSFVIDLGRIALGLGVKFVVTLHSDTDYARRIVQHAGAVILVHKPGGMSSADCHVLPIGIPVFDLPNNVISVRAKYGFQPNDVIASTFGFLLPWKQFPETLEVMLGWLRSAPHHRVQLLTSYHAMQGIVGDRIRDRIRNWVCANRLHAQVHHVTNFLSVQEICERLWLSDVGYLFAPFNTQSMSAAARMFTAARCPLVASESSHYTDADGAIVHAPLDINGFASVVLRVLEPRFAPLRVELRSRQERLYLQRNWRVIAERHVTEVYG